MQPPRHAAPPEPTFIPEELETTMKTQKHITRRQAAAALAITVATVSAPMALHAQTAFPNKPIRVVVPSPAGSSPDVMARFWADRLQRVLGQPILIDNRPGAATIIGAQAVAGAPADGYTLLYTIGSTFSINPYIYSKLPYKTEDFTPVVMMAGVPYVLVVAGNSPYRTVQDLVRAAKEKPGELTYASYGIGTTTQAVFVRFTNVAGVKMTHVPYKDGGITDMIGGLVKASFEPSTTAIPFVKSGRLRGLAVTSARRLESLPDVPTVAETFPGQVADGWLGLLAPRGTPPEVVALIASASNKIIQADDFKAKALELGLQPGGGAPAEFQRFMVEDAKVWSKVAKDNDIKVE
jgi:tripartite-type tricarboxylate transporter receptor subunit TctC